mgnify:CR=1 FL=1
MEVKVIELSGTQMVIGEIINEGNEDVDGEGNTEFVDKRVERMQRVVDASVEVIGEAKSLYNLAFTFVDTGKLSQAKKLLATPGLRYDHSKIKWMMEKWAEAETAQNIQSQKTLFERAREMQL